MCLFRFQEAIDGIEFARGDSNSTWGSVRAAMGHPEPFELKYVAVGNEDCDKTYYRGFYIFLCYLKPFLKQTNKSFGYTNLNTQPFFRKLS